MSTTTTFSRPWMMTLSALVGAGVVLAAGCGSDRSTAEKHYEPAKPVVAPPAPVPVGAKEHRLLKDTPFERSWDLQLPRPVVDSWISGNIPDLVFFEMEGTHEIYAVDAFSGNTRWVTPPFPKPLRLTPSVSRVKSGDNQGTDDRLWVVSDDVLYSIDAVFGQIVWRYQLPFSPSTSPLALGPEGNQRIFLGDWDGRMQVATFQTEKHFPYILWQINTRNAITAPLTEADTLVYGADQAGTVHCFKYDREEVWAFKTGSAIYGAPLARARVLFVGNEDNVLYALNRLTGEKLGALYLNGPIKRAPFAFKAEPARIYAWVDSSDTKVGGLYAIKTQVDNVPFVDNTRHPLEVERIGQEWFVPKVDRLVGSTPDYLFATAGSSPMIFAVNRASGNIDWSWDPSEDHRAHSRNIAYMTQYQDSSDLNRSIYSVDGEGHVIAYRVYGDKPGDPLSGDRVAVKTTKIEVPAAAGDKAAGDKPAADKPAGDKPAAAEKPAAADKAAAPAK